MTALNTFTFSDLDFNFQINPTTGDLALSINDMAIIRSVKNLVLTNFYEKPFHSEIGSNVNRLLFENPTGLTAQNIKKAVEEVIKNYEPRVELVEIVVQYSPQRDTFQIVIEFFIQNAVNTTTVNVFLKRVR